MTNKQYVHNPNIKGSSVLVINCFIFNGNKAKYATGTPRILKMLNLEINELVKPSLKNVFLKLVESTGKTLPYECTNFDSNMSKN